MCHHNTIGDDHVNDRDDHEMWTYVACGVSCDEQGRAV